MKKTTTAKIFAAIALFGIIFSFLGTGILFWYQSNYGASASTPTFEDYLKNNPIQVSPTSTGETATGELILTGTTNN